ncbi:peptidoglycan-binding protein [Motiliproteus coralliicola]|uniref:Peptidoglycan-binding protein n=1 Tax=Motiliproteus coralliicola TaxID=2283196 RepID=A0A369WCM9_9GAMM|nr:peptidoglycan-binding protein [Motiliproteus coralliicola]
MLLGFFSSTLATAADSQGRFAVRNAGMVSCEKFIEEKSKNSPTFNLYMGWIDGYLSAANQFTDETFDLVPWGNTPFLAALLENHCNKNLNQRFYIAVNMLAGTLLEQRLTEHSDLVVAANENQKTYIYKQVLKQVQQQLKQSQLYRGSIDGIFGNTTVAALEDYQRAQGIKVTGLPDQVTLYKLLRSRSAK